jgi:kinesin family protein 2/24
VLSKKDAQLNKLTDEEVLADLKDKSLPTFGTKQEKLDRLKKYYGNPFYDYLNQIGVLQANNVKASVDFGDKVDTEPSAAQNKKEDPSKKAMPKSNVVDEIEKMKQRREERRLKMEEAKREKADREAENEANGRMGDVEFELMIDKNRFKQPLLQNHTQASQLRLCVCVRKRPIFKKEEVAGEIDAISCANPQIVVHEPKFKVDGITKYIENSSFTFDNSFNEGETNEDIYKYSIGPHVEFILNKGIVTCFAYGQTGSGKTFTMKGIQTLVISDLFKMASTKYK